MVIKNASVLTADRGFISADIRFGGVIEDVGHIPGEGLNAQGLYLVPGFVDIHTHGATGGDSSDASAEALERMSRYYASRGVTSFLATTMTLGEAALERAMRIIAGFSPRHGAQCMGINMEGPFINPEKKGAQAGKDIVRPDFDMFARLFEASGGIIRLVDVAPEMDAGFEFIRKASKLCRVSLAHTTASYEIARQAFAAGASHVTHLFNAMSPFHQFDPGVIGAASDCAACVEIICDGIHIHPCVIRNIFRMFPHDRICLISDSMRSAGLADGDYDLGGQRVLVRQGRATLEDGTIAASTISVADAVRNAVAFGISPEAALAAATINPARAAGIDDRVGSIERGKRADLLLLDRDLNPVKIFIAGKEYA